MAYETHELAIARLSRVIHNYLQQAVLGTAPSVRNIVREIHEYESMGYICASLIEL